MLALYYTFIYEPIFNLLVWLYNVIPGNDIGVAIVALTIVIRALLYPLTKKSLSSQKALQEIQPKVQELQNKYKGEKEKLAQEMMKLYKEEKVSPFSSCLPLLIQLPFLIAVYHVFGQGLVSQGFDQLYPFVANPGTIDTVSFGIINLAESSIIIALFAGASQFWQAKMMIHNKPPKPQGKELEGAKDEKMLAAMNKQMLYFMPLMTIVIGSTLPAGLTLYWFVSTLLMGLQQVYLFRNSKKPEVEYIKPEGK